MYSSKNHSIVPATCSCTALYMYRYWPAADIRWTPADIRWHPLTSAGHQLRSGSVDSDTDLDYSRRNGRVFICGIQILNSENSEFWKLTESTHTVSDPSSYVRNLVGQKFRVRCVPFSADSTIYKINSCRRWGLLAYLWDPILARSSMTLSSVEARESSELSLGRGYSKQVNVKIGLLAS